MLRDNFSRCPRCHCGLDQRNTRLSCGQCHGVLVPESELIDQIATEQAMVLLQPRKRSAESTWMEFVRELPPVAEVAEPALGCPRCGATMTKHVLFAQTIDRCAGHGVWLDGTGELRAILAAAIAGF